MTQKRIKTKHPGVYYREVQRVGKKGTEKVFYIVFKKDGKVYEEKAGRQYADNMTPAKAASIRADRIEGKRQSRKEIREQEEARAKAEQNKWPISRLWEFYKENKTDVKRLDIDECYYRNYIGPKFGDKEPKDLALFDIDRLRLSVLRDKKSGKNRSPATAKKALELLRRIIKYAEKRQLCQGLNFKIEMPKVNNQKTEDLTPEQLLKLLEAIDKDSNIMAANIMKMALYSGMRRGEMFNLQWQDIDFERGFIHTKNPKGGNDQKIPLNESARELLLNHPRTDSPYVFPGRGGRRRTDIKKQVNRIKNRAGLPKDFRALHGLRHVYASMLASSGQVDMYTLQKLLTHKSPIMTQRYAHLRDEALRKASNLAGDIINQAIEKNSLEKADIIDFKNK